MQAPPPKVSMNSPKEHLSWGPGHVQNVNLWAGPVLTTTNSSGVREYPALFDRHCENTGQRALVPHHLELIPRSVGQKGRGAASDGEANETRQLKAELHPGLGPGGSKSHKGPHFVN